jgi:uncharacterized protein (TIGR02594 family)
MIQKRALASDPCWLKEAWKYNGIREIKGSKHNPTVVSFFKDVGHGWVKNDETAWCAAFVGACLAHCDMPHTGSLAARSYLQWGRNTTKPKRGDIVVFKRGNSTWQGHVAFYLGEASGRIYVLGGNQANAVNVRSYTKDKLLGYRTKPTVLNSRTMKAGMVGGATALGLVGEGLRSAQDSLSATQNEWFLVAAGIVGVVAAGVVMYARIDDWRTKAR